MPFRAILRHSDRMLTDFRETVETGLDPRPRGGLPTVCLFYLKQKFNSNSVQVSTILAKIYCGTHIYSTYSLIKMSFGCSFLTCDHVPVLM